MNGNEIDDNGNEIDDNGNEIDDNGFSEIERLAYEFSDLLSFVESESDWNEAVGLIEQVLIDSGIEFELDWEKVMELLQEEDYEALYWYLINELYQ